MMEAFMTPQERDLTTILLDRLNKIEVQPKDPEAETLIRETAAVRADAPYSLVQTMLIQDLSLHNAQSRITDLETQLAEPKCASSAPPSFIGAPNFLGAVFGGGEPSGAARTCNMPPGGAGTGPAPLGTTAQPGYAPAGGSAPPAPGGGLIGDGFLQSAAMTAAGIAGGALLFEGIRSVFGHHDAVSIIGNQPAVPGLAETVLNSHYGAEAGASGVGSTDEHVGARHNKPFVYHCCSKGDKDVRAA
jgi:uncharacterized protein